MQNNTTTDESTLKISLIDTKANQSSQGAPSFCQKYFQDCFLYLFLRKKSITPSKEDTKFSFSNPNEERQNNAADYFEINSNTHQKYHKSFFSKYKVENFPQNELFILEGASTRKPLLAKVTEKHFSKCHRHSSEDQQDFSKSDYNRNTSVLSNPQNDKLSKQISKLPYCFPGFSEKVKYGLEYMNESDLPDEDFAEHVANRTQGTLLLDFTAGIGEYSIRLAKTSCFVISFSNSLELTQCIKHNMEVYGVNNLDIVSFQEYDKDGSLKEFLVNNSRNNKADVVLLNPLSTIRNFSSKKIYDPYFRRLLKHLSIVSKSFLMVLPKHFQNFEGLADLMADALKKNERCGIEIEKVFKNNKLKHLVVYYGPISAIKGSEEMAFIHNMIEKVEENDFLEDSLKNAFRCVCNQVSNNYGNLSLLELVNKGLNEFTREKPQICVYSHMLDVFKKSNLHLICPESSKLCPHESLGLIKSHSSNFEQLKLKPLEVKQVNSSSTEEIGTDMPNRKLMRNCEGNSSTLLKSDRDQRHNKLYAIESFTSDLVSDYSKSFQGNIELEETENNGKSFLANDVKRFKRSESGAQQKMDSIDQFGGYFNSLKEESIV